MATTTKPNTEREGYLDAFEREYQTTLRVLKAYPIDKAQVKLTDRSLPPTQIAWALVQSQKVVPAILTMDSLSQKPPSQAPTDWKQILSEFEKSHAEASQALTKLDDGLFQGTITFPSGPGGATAPMRRSDVLWFMLFDTIHHRGQLTVYLRATGASVPSIYGGSEDEPWS